MRFDNQSYKINLRIEIFSKVNEKRDKKTAKKIERVWPRKVYPVRMEAITSRKTLHYKKKRKNIFDREK